MEKEDLIIIGGAPRSGTTLLQNMMDSHPSVYGGPEFGQFPGIIQLRRTAQRGVRSGYIDQYVSIEEVDSGLRTLAMTWLRGAAKKKPGCRISEKTPGNALYLKEILDLFPRAHGVHVLRDPRAVLASMMNVKERHDRDRKLVPQRLSSVAAMSSTIAEHFNAGVSACDDKPERCIAVRYEDLVQRPEKTLRALCKKISLDFNVAMLRPSEQEHDAQKLVDAGTPWYSAEEFKRDPDPSKIASWEEKVSHADLAELRKAFQLSPDVPGRFGYAFM